MQQRVKGWASWACQKQGCRGVAPVMRLLAQFTTHHAGDHLSSAMEEVKDSVTEAQGDREF